MAGKRHGITVLFVICMYFEFGDFTPELIVQSDGNFTLQPNVQGPMEDILWRWNTNKVIEFNRKGLREYGKFQGRTILDITTGALTLTHLRESDSGEYVGELQVEGELKYHHQNVTVFDAVDKPTVACQVNRTSVTLLCSGDDRPATQYRWEGPAIEPQPGPQLKIEAAETSDSVYTCVLNNPVSESRTELPVKSCFPAPVIIPLVIVLLLLLIIIIIIIVGLIYYKKCYKKKTGLKGEDVEAGMEEKQPLSPTDTENHEETTGGGVEDRVKPHGDMMRPAQAHDEHQKAALAEQHRGADGRAALSQEESQTGNEEDARTADPALELPTPEEEKKVERQDGDKVKTGLDSRHRPQVANMIKARREEIERRRRQMKETVRRTGAGSSIELNSDGAHRTPDGSVGVSQESQTESLIQDEDSDDSL
ncbi:hypothetical protein COCON_G00056370 [Conger conger]|uniref:Immunoglobulin domain-containing protein n=1 Tax=Conger conger TaxID=82655 RepID=A0A9Q1DWP5_CONCO|nr:hypothetical protein COCON_G00056370 [Conger conger]